MADMHKLLSPPIFIVGLPRSGSTLVSRMLGMHPDVVVFGEMHFLTPWRRDFRYFLRSAGDLRDEVAVRRLVNGLFSDPSPAGLRRGPYFWKNIRNQQANGLREALIARLLRSERRDLGDIFRAIIEEATRCRGGMRAVVKFPVFPAYVERLLEWWPESKIIYLTRDARAIAASKTNDPGGTARYVTRLPWLAWPLRVAARYFAILQYCLASRAHAKMQGWKNYRLLQYEALMNDHESVIKELCKFCELSPNSDMQRPPEAQASSISGLKSGGFDASRAEGWKKVLSPREAAFIEWVTRKSMMRFGYKVSQAGTV